MWIGPELQSIRMVPFRVEAFRSTDLFELEERLLFVSRWVEEVLKGYPWKKESFSHAFRSSWGRVLKTPPDRNRDVKKFQEWGASRSALVRSISEFGSLDPRAPLWPSLSHTRDLSIAAVSSLESRSVPKEGVFPLTVGVDVERADRAISIDTVARISSKQERSIFSDSDLDPGLFWVAKEAAFKAASDLWGLNEVSRVSLLPEQGSRVRDQGRIRFDFLEGPSGKKLGRVEAGYADDDQERYRVGLAWVEEDG